jgi:hypothetical protein
VQEFRVLEGIPFQLLIVIAASSRGGGDSLSNEAWSGVSIYCRGGNAHAEVVWLELKLIVGVTGATAQSPKSSKNPWDSGAGLGREQ